VATANFFMELKLQTTTLNIESWINGSSKLILNILSNPGTGSSSKGPAIYGVCHYCVKLARILTFKALTLKEHYMHGRIYVNGYALHDFI
jgi:predicted sugar kinase